MQLRCRICRPAANALLPHGTALCSWTVGKVVPWLTACFLFAVACAYPATAESDRTIAQYAHTAWGPRDGAPSVVKSLAQTTDGYLWLGCQDGLYRFDGVVFERYQPQSGGQLPHDDVPSLLALANGDLWIAFARTISLLRNGNVTNYTARDGVPSAGLGSLTQDRGGTIWAKSSIGPIRLEGDRWVTVGKDWNLPGKSANALFLDHQGNLWVSEDHTLFFLPQGVKVFQPTGIQVGQVWQIDQAPSGKLWMAETTRSVRPVPLNDRRKPSDDTEVQVGSEAILFDNDGAFWITSIGDGLRRAPTPEQLNGRIKEFGSEVESFTADNGLSNDFVRAILQDREGNIWVGTDGGLDRFRKTNLVPVPLPFRLHDATSATDDSGDLWIETTSLFRIHGNRVVRERPLPTDSNDVFSDRDGAIWWFSYDAIYRYKAGKYDRIPLPPSFPKPFEMARITATLDDSGVLWAAALDAGLSYRKAGRWQLFGGASKFVKSTPMRAFTDWKGRSWFEFEDGTIIILDHERIQTVPSSHDFPVGEIRVYNGRGQHLWAVGRSGVALFDGSHFRRIIPGDFEGLDSLIALEEASDGSLWLAENRGVIQIPAGEVRQALENPSYRIKSRLFDSLDGLSGSFAASETKYPLLQGTDGRLWISTPGGIAWIDPAHIFTNPLPPPVAIRSVKANDKQLDLPANVVLPPRTTDLKISYTALSLSAPERVRFRYMLEEVDKDWQDAGTRREALYTRLGPGKYRFRVIACNNDGVWNETGASLNFSIAPAYYQTYWFQALCFMAFLALLWALYQLRVRQLHRQFAIGLEARVNERTRIARDLHDTLLQSFNALLLRLQTVSNALPAKPEEAKRRVDVAIEQASHAIAEGRDAVHELRLSGQASPELGRDIHKFAMELLGDASQDASPEVDVEVEGTPKPLNPVVRDEVYRIAAEAVRNSIRHAKASRIEIEVRYDENQLRLRFGDNGTGIDPAILERDHKPGHWGLRGMRERAKLVGGVLEVQSRTGVGTEVELTIPATNVYAKPLSRRWFFFRGR
jgi:signal transduction histidine kinase/streptogramin lyase